MRGVGNEDDTRIDSQTLKDGYGPQFFRLAAKRQPRSRFTSARDDCLGVAVQNTVIVGLHSMVEVVPQEHHGP